MDQFSSYLVTGGTNSSILLLIYVFIGLAMVFSVVGTLYPRLRGRPPVPTTATPGPSLPPDAPPHAQDEDQDAARRAPGVTAVLDDILRSIGVYRLYESSLNSQIESGPIPGHIGIILDGNRRWAQNHRLTVDLGHTQGADVVERLLDWCHEIGIKSITLYVLSTENLSRSSEEVAELFRLIEERLRRLLNDERIYKYKVRVKGIGKFDLLPQEMRDDPRRGRERRPRRSRATS